MPKATAQPAPEPDPNYDPQAIFAANGPINPAFMREAVRTLLRTLPIDPAEPQAWSTRRIYSALLALAALNPRDEIEVMLAVQVLSAQYAAAACWRLGMNYHQPNGDSTRHISAAGAAARTFDAMLKALERRQAKALSVPTGRPPSRIWVEQRAAAFVADLDRRCREADAEPEQPPSPWSPEAIAETERLRGQHERDAQVQGLDIANTEGILPDGSMIVPENPTPQQEAYIARRLGLEYQRSYNENRRKGVEVLPVIRAVRVGDRVP